MAIFKPFKRVAIVILGLMAALTVAILSIFYPTQTVIKEITIETGGRTVTVQAEIADNPAKWSKGLMNREHLGASEGMFFIFSDEQPRTFWMLNTLIPLDMIFIGSNGRVVSMIENAPPCRTENCGLYRSGFPARYVLEMNGGFVKQEGIQIGDKVKAPL